MSKRSLFMENENIDVKPGELEVLKDGEWIETTFDDVKSGDKIRLVDTDNGETYEFGVEEDKNGR